MSWQFFCFRRIESILLIFMLMKKLYSIGLIALLLAATQGCKKDDNLPDTITDTTAYLGIYQPKNIKSLEDVVMYTPGGIVTDASFIQNFLNRRAYLSDFDFSNDSVAYSSTMRLYFEEGGGVMFVTGSDTVRTSEVSKSSSEIVVEDNYTSITQITQFTETMCDSLYRIARKAKPSRFYSNNYPPPTGSDTAAHMQLRYLIEVSNEGYTLPLMTIATTSAGNGCNRLFTGIWNVADAGSLNNLAGGDTVVVQMGRVKLEKL